MWVTGRDVICSLLLRKCIIIHLMFALQALELSEASEQGRVLLQLVTSYLRII